MTSRHKEMFNIAFNMLKKWYNQMPNTELYEQSLDYFRNLINDSKETYYANNNDPLLLELLNVVRNELSREYDKRKENGQ